jgi:hypothetical protein
LKISRPVTPATAGVQVREQARLRLSEHARLRVSEHARLRKHLTVDFRE